MSSGKHFRTQAGKGGLSVSVNSADNFERTLRRFKKMVLASGVLADVRARQAYIRPGEVTRQKKLLAIRRQKRQSDENPAVVPTSNF